MTLMMQPVLMDGPPPTNKRQCRRCGGKDHTARKCNGTPLPGWEAIRERETRIEAERIARKHPVRPKSFAAARVSQAELTQLKLLNESEEPAEHPRTRGECQGGPRPCPLVGCKYNLFLQVNPETGTMRLQFPDREPWHMPEKQSCALDVADEGGASLEHIGGIMNITRERVRQIEVRGLKHAGLGRDGEDLKTYLGSPSRMTSSPLGEVMNHSSRGEGEPEDDSTDRSHIPSLPHVLDQTVTDEQYADAMHRIWERWQDNRQAEARGELHVVAGRYVSTSQRAIIECIRESWKVRGRAPTVGEMAQAVGIDGDSIAQSISGMLRNLRDLGMVTGKREQLQLDTSIQEAPPVQEPAPVQEPPTPPHESH
jgi:hypothetical protein